MQAMLTELSDKSLKTNILPLKSPLQKLIKLGGYTYNWIDDKQRIMSKLA